MLVCADEAPFAWWEQRRGGEDDDSDADADTSSASSWRPWPLENVTHGARWGSHASRGARMACAADLDGDAIVDVAVVYKYARSLVWFRGAVTDGVLRTAEAGGVDG